MQRELAKATLKASYVIAARVVRHMKAFMIAEELILSPLLVMFFFSLIWKTVVKHL